MCGSLNLGVGFVMEPPNQTATRFGQRNLNTRWELLLLHYQNQLVVNIPLKQRFILLRVSLLRLIPHLTRDFVNRVKWMVHKVENIAHDSDRVFDA